MLRIECFRELAPMVEDCLVVVALGGTTEEWHHVHPSDANFFNVPMGSNMPLAMGLALAVPRRKVVLLDTDGCQLMTLGALCTVANNAPPNLRIFIMDNESYAETGTQASATSGKADLAGLALAAGIEGAITVRDLDAFREAANGAIRGNGLSYVVAKVEAQRTTGLVRGFDHVEAKYRFVRYMERLLDKEILTKS